MQPQGDSCLVSIFRDDKKNRYLLPVNHAIDRPRELTLLFAKDVTGLERDGSQDRSVACHEAGRSGRRQNEPSLTLAPGDGEFLRVLPFQK